MVNAKLTLGVKEYEVRIDLDSDLFSEVAIDEKLSERIVSEEDGREFYVTSIFDLFSNYKNIQLEKYN